MNPVLAAFLANVSFAVSDIVIAVLIKHHNSSLRISFWKSILTLVLFSPMLFFSRGELQSMTFYEWFQILGLGIVLAFGSLFFVRGLADGNAILGGVIGGSFPAVSALVAVFFFGETLAVIEVGAIGMVLCGVLLSSLSAGLSPTSQSKGTPIWYSLGALLLWGVYFALIDIPVENVGWFLPQYLSFVSLSVVYLAMIKFSKETDCMRLPKPLKFFAISIPLGILAGLFYNYAIGSADTAVTAPIAGSSPAIYVLLAYVFFKERLRWIQLSGVFLALFGIVLLAM